MPWCDHTGTPRHFHSSVTPGTACRITERTCASVRPRQSGSSAIRASMRAVGESAAVGALAAVRADGLAFVAAVFAGAVARCFGAAFALAFAVAFAFVGAAGFAAVAACFVVF